MRRPTVYLDASTLGDAFDAVHGTGRASQSNAYTRLYVLVAKIASEGTLCISSAHVLELLNRYPKMNALEMASCLDRLKPTWTKRTGLAEKEELEWWLRKEPSLQCPDRYLPFTDAFTSAIAIPVTPAASADILSNPTITAYVENAHGHPGPMDPRFFSLENFRDLHLDRNSLPEGVGAAEVERVTKEKLRAGILDESRRIASTLGQGGCNVKEADVMQAAERLWAQASAIPLNRLYHHVLCRIGEVISIQVPTSHNFEKRYRSLIYDLEHLSGAAYCDVFTCDHFIDKRIGTFRADLGFQRQISVHGATVPGAFVAELEAQCGWEQVHFSG